MHPLLRSEARTWGQGIELKGGLGHTLGQGRETMPANGLLLRE